MRIAGNIIVLVGIVFILFGVIGIFKFKNFYTRILVATKIDTVGAITIIIGIAVRHGLSFFSMKALLLIVLVIIVNPLTSHMIARSAYLSGYRTDDRTGVDYYSEDHV